MKDPDHIRVPKVGEIKRIGCGTLFAYPILFLLSLGLLQIAWTLVAPYVIEKACELPHTVSKKETLDNLVTRLKNDFLTSNHSQEMWWHGDSIRYLYELTTRDQLYVIHNAIINAKGLFHNQKSTFYEYKISPLYLNGIVHLIDPQIYISSWVSVRIHIWDERKNVSKSIGTPRYSPTMRRRFPGLDIASGSGPIHALKLQSSPNICPELASTLP